MSRQTTSSEAAMARILGSALSAEGLRRTREEVFGMSRRDFAHRTGVSETSLGRYERGEMPIPPWMGLVLSAVLYDMPAFRGQMLRAAGHVYSLRQIPPQARLAYLSSCFAAAALADSESITPEALEKVEAEPNQLRAIAGTLRIWAELSPVERLPWHHEEEEGAG